ncbi:hypothetical protein QBC34DRAFT_404266 [Podospora aff. communis PSN243]|uniref:Secreted protein n=1 Tax=Podospora aff. communis PSN243 TaxID=3040156 RepID=A0AAV9GM82_9PEZI|nr:hypothetical protein QBC34DRAFT_404266 [Podospora aff. communis PSN243]
MTHWPLIATALLIRRSSATLSSRMRYVCVLSVLSPRQHAVDAIVRFSADSSPDVKPWRSARLTALRTKDADSHAGS